MCEPEATSLPPVLIGLLQRDIRGKVVQVAAERGVAKQSQSHPKAPGADAESAVEEEQERSPCGPLQMSLLDLGE